MPSKTEKTMLFDGRERFSGRHIGPRRDDIGEMLRIVGMDSLEELIDRALPGSIRMQDELGIGEPRSEREVLSDLQELSDRNVECRNFIGMGYDECITPPVIKRCILESPGWYTAYTPYQPEISQGRLEALLNFQTMVIDLTGLEVANSSLLDEGTAAAEAMTLCLRLVKRGGEGKTFFVSENCHPQVIEVLQTRALPIGVEVVVGDHRSMEFAPGIFGALVQYPDTNGRIHDYREFCRQAHESGALVVAAADLLALTLLTPPGEFGADVAIGSTQRFGQPLGFGGPHAAYLACKDAHKRQIPGRLVGVSVDAEGNPAIRLAMQTREQHIRRDKATSNICTSQVLLAVIASAYAVYHGPDGLRDIAERIHLHAAVLARMVKELGHAVAPGPFFDTLRITPSGIDGAEIISAAESRRMNLRLHENGDIGVSLGETVTYGDLVDLYHVFGGAQGGFGEQDIAALAAETDVAFPETIRRTGSYLDNPVFHLYRSETELMRYLHRLESRDLALNTAMIPLGSCTMKLNAAAEMFPIEYPGFANIHPFAPSSQTEGYGILLERLGGWLADITGFSAVSFMPNSGAQGEYSGLQVIRAYHASRGDHGRDVCLIPESAHGTNPASAVMAGMQVVVVACDEDGNIDPGDLRAKAEEYMQRLGALMITYPSTHGIFEEAVKEICETVHANGGQVYLDGANMNALVGVCRLVDLGADVCHLNLHKTFSNPHGGGGPGMGPIAVAPHLQAFLPTHPVVPTGGRDGIGAVSSAPYGSAGILPIPYAYIAMMGTTGLKKATGVAVLAANYVAKRLEGHFDLLYRGRNGLVAHECIIDTRPFREIGISVDDIAKRLMDYGFHAPTMSWPVAGTLMVEPTESESREELDRFCDAMIMIRDEIREVEEGRADSANNVLTNAPHTAQVVASDDWNRPYSREKAAFPTRWTRENKFWPYVARVDNAHGDRHLVCACPAVENYK